MGVVSALAHHSHNMKFLVLSACVVVASAAPSYHAAASFHGLVGHPNGAVVPVDEPAVAAARADHLTALAATHGAHAGYGHAAPVAAVHAAPIAAVHAAPVAAVAHAAPVAAVHAAPIAHHGYAGPLNLNTHLVAHPNGAVVPADEPAVAAARADHFAAGGGHAGHAVVAHAAPVAAVAHAAPVAAVAHAAVPIAHGVHGLVGHANGAVVPVDEPAVQAARAAHFAAGGGHHY